jgi:hypothetical protein
MNTVWMYDNKRWGAKLFLNVALWITVAVRHRVPVRAEA